MDEHLGSDLAVAPSFVAHDASSLDVTTVVKIGPRLAAAGPGSREIVDLAMLSGRDNLAQALLLRLLTPAGSLAGLGHSAYGSRLHLLIGESKNEALRNRCRAYVLEAVAQEPRVERAVAVEFDPQAETISDFQLILSVRPVSGGDPVTLGLEVGLAP